ncbi:MAG: FAD-binding domain-containing protein [Oceanipulchritudo sp.]
MGQSQGTHLFSTLPVVAEREAGLQMLREFVPFALGYAESRNFDRPGNPGTSGLSPFIRTRLVREREAVEAVLRRYPYLDVSRFIEEICWRTYWKGFLEMRPSIWDHYLEESVRLPGCLVPPQDSTWERARDGQTGIGCFDAWAAQLRSTGWLHNHARMSFASIWIFTLRLPWQLGAAFFLEHLLDGDPASNTLSWRWVAGLHTPGKHYLARAENIRRFTEGRFFPDGQLNENAEPLPPDNLPDPSPLPQVPTPEKTAFPSLSKSPAGLLVTPEDLSPEIGELAETPFSTFAVFNAIDRMEETGASPMVREFLDGAVADTARRISGNWSARSLSCRGSVERVRCSARPENVGCHEMPRVYWGCLDHWIDGVVTWADNENLKSVWMFQPPVGAWRSATQSLRCALRARNIELLEFRRKWDALHWPHAHGGYFSFRKGLWDRLKALSPGIAVREPADTGSYR